MKIQIHSITVRATILPDDWDSSNEMPDPIERTFTPIVRTSPEQEIPRMAGWIEDMFSIAKRYLFHNTNNTPQPIPTRAASPPSSKGENKRGSETEGGVDRV